RLRVGDSKEPRLPRVRRPADVYADGQPPGNGDRPVTRARRILNTLVCDERGVAMVQFALVLPVMLLLIFGAIEGGMLMWQFQQGEIASKRAVRLASTRTLMTAGAIGDCGPSTPASTPAGTLCSQVPDTNVWATCKGDGSSGGMCGPDIAR